MKKGRYEEIVQHANNIAEIKVRVAYLEGVIETEDLDHTDYNRRVVQFKKDLMNQIREDKPKHQCFVNRVVAKKECCYEQAVDGS